MQYIYIIYIYIYIYILYIYYIYIYIYRERERERERERMALLTQRLSSFEINSSSKPGQDGLHFTKERDGSNDSPTS